jgi:2-haloacid dehalogenase
MDADRKPQTWPDLIPALRPLKKPVYRLAFLNNFTSGMLEANIKNAGLDGRFDYMLRSDRAKTFKRDPRAYQLGSERDETEAR